MNFFVYSKDETQLKVGSELIWLWVAIIESETKNILAISISKEKYVCGCRAFSI
jgi:transposase-like protein